MVRKYYIKLIEWFLNYQYSHVLITNFIMLCISLICVFGLHYFNASEDFTNGFISGFIGGGLSIMIRHVINENSKN